MLDHVKRLAQAGFARHIRFVETYDPSLPHVLGSRDQLIQVFLNLVKNAAEAIGEDSIDGEIILTTAYRPGVRLRTAPSAEPVGLPLEICVRDNGPGIAPEIAGNLFDPFVTTKSPGSGLGLALVAKLIGDHGGIIECESHPRRTTFRVLMPLAVGARRGAMRSRASGRRSLRKCRQGIFSSPTTTRRFAPFSIRRCRAPATRCARPARSPGLWRWVAAGEGDLVITDVVMPDDNAFDLLPRIKRMRPDLPIIVMSAQNTFMTAIKASERGAYEYLPKPFDLHELVAHRRTRARRAQAAARGGGRSGAGRERCRSSAARRRCRTSSGSLARLMQTDLTVMISGESGTGKELVARALHDYGKRKSGPFVAINMAAIPRDLIESELFGHEKGAFTGAAARSVGRFEQAEGGTLFLDEIGDMPMEAQTRLLRVLQQGEYTTVGGRTPIKTNVRIVAATNKDLRFAIQQGAFREDLFFRLNVVPLRLPPLRERPEDIPDLVRAFFQRGVGRGPAGQDGRVRGDGATETLSLAWERARARKPHSSSCRALSPGCDRRGA